MPTIGTHNLRDEHGTPHLFAHAIGYTEAIPRGILARVRTHRRRVAARAKARLLKGYTVRVCKRQRDLVMALRRRHYKITRTRYVPVHGGRRKVTPHRGTFVVETVRRKGRLRRPTGRREVFLLCHRINAAFPPYKRGEPHFRAAMWAKHEQTDAELVDQYRANGWVVHLLGDLNTPPGVKGTTLPHEAGRGFDRIASTQRLYAVVRMSRAGSDHHRWRATYI